MTERLIACAMCKRAGGTLRHQGADVYTHVGPCPQPRALSRRLLVLGSPFKPGLPPGLWLPGGKVPGAKA